MKNEAEIQTFIKSLPRVFDEKTLLIALDRFKKEINLSETGYKRIFKAKTRIQLHWNLKTVKALYTFIEDYSILDLLSAWTNKEVYLSHFSALYFHGLVDQQPKEHFVSTELKTHSNSESRELNESLLRQSFMKGYRVQQNFCFYNGIKIFFVEKANLNHVGVISKELTVDPYCISLKLTSVERTLIDSVVSPQYSGGMDAVRSAFSRAEIDLKNMVIAYDSMKFLYPYWQTIGFLLEQTKGKELAERWLAVFGKPKMDFYFDRNYRTDWSKDEKWRLFVPKGVVSGN